MNKFLKLNNIRKYLCVFCILIIIIIFEYYYNKSYNNCLECYKDYHKQKCINCNIKKIFKGLKILSDETTLNEIIRNNKSISRFGGGEFLILFGAGIHFQNKNNLLSKKLEKY